MIYVEKMEEEPGSPAQAERLALQQMSGNGSKLHHDNEDEDEAKEVGQRRRIVIRKNTLLPHNQPPHYYQSRKASAGQAGKATAVLVRPLRHRGRAPARRRQRAFGPRLPCLPS